MNCEALFSIENKKIIFKMLSGDIQTGQIKDYL